VGAIQQRHRRERARLAHLEDARERMERESGVDDVLDQEHVLAADVLVEILEQPNAPQSARALPVVALQLDEVDSMQNRHGAREVGEEDDACLEQPDEQWIAARVVGPDLLTELGDTSTDFRRAQIRLAELGTLQPYDARFRWYRSARRSMSRL